MNFIIHEKFSPTQSLSASKFITAVWGAEQKFKRLEGVVATCVGYTDSPASTEIPTYESVCAGSGHAEAVLVAYDPAVLSYEVCTILAVSRLFQCCGYDCNLLIEINSSVSIVHRSVGEKSRRK